jgi:hypothetical protein
MLHTYIWRLHNGNHQTLLERGNGNITTCSRYTVCMYGIKAIKSPHIINVCCFKIKIKEDLTRVKYLWYI